MASKQAILCSLCILHFQVVICESRNVPSREDARIEHQNKASAGVHLNTSSDVIIRLGERLQLNCTITGAKNSSKYQLSWYHGAHLASHFTKKLSNETVQLNIDHVGWNNNGTYFCKETGNNSVQPRHVIVRVGDIPSSPQAVWINNIEFRTRIHWTAPAHSGRLPLSYTVKGQCKNTTLADLPECSTDTFTLCESFGILSGPELNTFVCLASAVLHQYVVTYNAIVEARNVLGLSRSSPVEFNHNQYEARLTTPQPAVSFVAKEVVPAGTVRLSWEDAKKLRPIEVKYTILYHKDGDRDNKSLILYPPRINKLITGLSPFSRFYFYLLVQYGYENTTIYGTYSNAAVQTVMTKVSAPSRPPTITNCSEWSNLSDAPGLIVTWVFPPAEYFNGPLKYTNINYRCQRGSHKIAGNVSASNMTARSAVIPVPQPFDKCYVWMRICNRPQLCSGISNTCVTTASPKDDLSPPPSKNSVAVTVMISLTGTIGGLGLVIIISTLCIRSRRRENGERRLPPLANVLRVMPHSAHGYDEIEEPLVNHNYDVINV